METIKVQSSCFSNYYKLTEARNRWIPQVSCCRKPEGLTFKSLKLNLKERLMSLASSNHSSIGNGFDFKQKRICVANTDTWITINTKLLDAYEDEYDGVVIDPECLPSSANAFTTILQSSLSYWKQEGKRGVWLKILEQQADLVPIALKEGFSYHHAEPGYAMLTYWLPDEPCMLPSTATHQVGIGAFVINGNKEVLVVKENRCPLRCSGIWKLPTGFIDKSEEILVGAIREVREETGINTDFLEVVAFRHAHHVAFEKSDLFFLCMLRPLSYEITVDGSEIQAAKWMPLDEFLELPFHREDKMLKSMIDICVARYENRYHGFTARRIMSKFDDRLAYLYKGHMKDSINLEVSYMKEPFHGCILINGVLENKMDFKCVIPRFLIV